MYPIADGVKSSLKWHTDHMKKDSGYRATFKYLMKVLAERPGPLGRTVRNVVAAHRLLSDVL